jgi:hypothetical protein
MVVNSSRLRGRERKAAALGKRVRQRSPEVGCNERGSGSGWTLEGRGSSARWARREYDERDRKENGVSSHLLFNETRLPLGELGDVRRDEVLRRVRCACTRSSSAPSGVGEPVGLEGRSRRSSRWRSGGLGSWRPRPDQQLCADARGRRVTVDGGEQKTARPTRGVPRLGS